MREDILDMISDLELEATAIFAHYSLEKFVVILGNILSHPHEDKYKTLKMDNNVFYSNVGRFTAGIKLLKFIGFEVRRLPENNKLAYTYAGRVSKEGDFHPLMQIAYDELKIALAKLKQGQGDGFNLGQDVP